jgi:hypothetical protein
MLVLDDTFTNGRAIASAAALKVERARVVVGSPLAVSWGANWPPAAHLVDSLADRDLELGRCVLDL